MIESSKGLPLASVAWFPKIVWKHDEQTISRESLAHQRTKQYLTNT